MLPALIVVSGTFINGRFTRRLPLIAAWLLGFAAQAAVRSWSFGLPFESALGPMSGLAFILFTFYMLTDPATTPSDAGRRPTATGSSRRTCAWAWRARS